MLFFKTWVIFTLELLSEMSKLLSQLEGDLISIFMPLWKSWKWEISRDVSVTRVKNLNTCSLVGWLTSLSENELVFHKSATVIRSLSLRFYFFKPFLITQLLYFTQVYAYPHEADNSTTVERAGRRRGEKKSVIDDCEVKCLICTVFYQIITHIESSWICINLIRRNERGS